MEARVDIRKLQQLNDRINQVLDALSQVRLSVYGLSHTGAPVGGAFAANPWAAQAAQIAAQQAAQAAVQAAQAQAGISPYATSISGLGHSPFIPQVNVPQVGISQLDPRLMAQTAVTSPFVGAAGLLHSPLLAGAEWTDQAYMDARASDPFRLARTFPYAFAGASPLSTGLR